MKIQFVRNLIGLRKEKYERTKIDGIRETV